MARADAPNAFDATGNLDEIALEEALRHHSAGNTPGFLLRHATLRWQRHVAAALADMSLTHVQFLVLSSTWWLGRTGEAPRQRDVAEHAGLEAVMTSQVLKVLERDGHIERVRDTDDARAVRVMVTAQGRDLARRCVVIMGRIDVDYFAEARAIPGFMDGLRLLAGRDITGSPTPS
ncbi:MarR family winged helix-turn-helix transcriptional regulator [Rhizohabitans arisaemae]|uniref:MarR family winged helix-turn-helix transcriptional regulator n=1 Tax=Rhizohabitans arisaemae TaxID=2720610 RepID=UPI0024B1FC91|nr:MarR family winged helix-turn-helix transcriptional regulator [Rhizohabitans arisaemae]